MKLLINDNQVVIAKGEISIIDEGFLVENTIFGTNLNLTLIETNLIYEEIIPQKHRLVDGLLVDNVDFNIYLESEKQKSIDQLLNDLVERGVI